MDSSAADLGRAHEFRRKWEKDDAEDPEEHSRNQHDVVRLQTFECAVLCPPESAYHDKAQSESQKLRAILSEEMPQPGGSDVARRIHQWEYQQRHGDCDHRIAEGDQAPEAGFVMHAPLSQVSLECLNGSPHVFPVATGRARQRASRGSGTGVGVVSGKFAVAPPSTSNVWPVM